MGMRRFQMLLDEDLDEALERVARREGLSKAELLRRYARERVTDIPLADDDPLWGLAGVAGEDLAPDDLTGSVSERVTEAVTLVP